MSAVPPRTPLACGALGTYDLGTVHRLALAMPAPLGLHHADERSALFLDREPIRWDRAGQGRGLAWSEAIRPRGKARSWRDAACELAAAGLAIEGRRRLVHSSVSGVAPVYYLRHGDAVYFASRIDPLVAAVPVDLTVDWRAWSSIICLRYPIGSRTPFEEVRRLPPFSVLTADESGVEMRRKRWPWREVEPSLGVEEGADAVLEAMRASIATLGDGPVVCPLSGGLDSRMLLCLLREAGVEVVGAVTANPDRGWNRDEVVASEVAGALDVPHELVSGSPDHYWDEARQRALRCDFQLTGGPWTAPLARRLGQVGAVATDGLALDTLSQPGKRFFTEEMTHPDGSDAVARELWNRMAGTGSIGRVRRGLLRADLARSAERRARSHFMRVTEPFRGHPAEPVLAFYSTRTVRGVSLTPHTVLGAEAAVCTPFAVDAIARACLAIRAPEKHASRLYVEVFRRLHRIVGELPSTRDSRDPRASRVPSRRLSPKVLDGYAQVLASGPLASYLGDKLTRRIDADDLGPALAGQPSRSIVQAVVLFHLWHERYASRLSGADPAEAFDLETEANRVALASGVARGP